MSSNRRVLSSRANGARSRGPVTPEGKRRSSYNAIRHGLLADCVRLECEDPEIFHALLQQHIDRFQPADDIEFGFIEEMVAACWRLRRCWAIETRSIDNAVAAQTVGDSVDRLVAAVSSPLHGDMNPLLLQRYETRLHMMYQRALHNLMLLRKAGIPNEPNPVSEHDPVLEDVAPLTAPSKNAGIPNEPNPITEHIPVPEDVAPAPAPSKNAGIPNEPNPISEHNPVLEDVVPAPAPSEEVAYGVISIPGWRG
jgi:hypothetical protein